MHYLFLFLLSLTASLWAETPPSIDPKTGNSKNNFKPVDKAQVPSTIDGFSGYNPAFVTVKQQGCEANEIHAANRSIAEIEHFRLPEIKEVQGFTFADTILLMTASMSPITAITSMVAATGLYSYRKKTELKGARRPDEVITEVYKNMKEHINILSQNIDKKFAINALYNLQKELLNLGVSADDSYNKVKGSADDYQTSMEAFYTNLRGKIFDFLPSVPNGATLEEMLPYTRNYISMFEATAYIVFTHKMKKYHTACNETPESDECESAQNDVIAHLDTMDDSFYKFSNTILNLFLPGIEADNIPPKFPIAATRSLIDRANIVKVKSKGKKALWHKRSVTIEYKNGWAEGKDLYAGRWIKKPVGSNATCTYNLGKENKCSLVAEYKAKNRDQVKNIVRLCVGVLNNVMAIYRKRITEIVKSTYGSLLNNLNKGWTANRKSIAKIKKYLISLETDEVEGPADMPVDQRLLRTLYPDDVPLRNGHQVNNAPAA